MVIDVGLEVRASLANEVGEDIARWTHRLAQLLSLTQRPPDLDEPESGKLQIVTSDARAWLPKTSHGRGEQAKSALRDNLPLLMPAQGLSRLRRTHVVDRRDTRHRRRSVSERGRRLTPRKIAEATSVRRRLHLDLDGFEAVKPSKSSTSNIKHQTSNTEH
jgi:hypothetical protein